MALFGFLFCSLLLALHVNGQSFHGFPGSYRGFDDFGDSFGRHGFRAPSRHQDYYRPACPQYNALQLSEWQPTSGGYKLEAVLPGVRSAERRTQLSTDGKHVEIRGIRPVPTRGRMLAPECLPRSAQLSENGRYEILEASIALPRDADVAGATVRPSGHDGIQVTVPVPRRSEPVTEPKASRAAAPVPKLPQRPPVQLPSSAGVEVVDEEFIYPKKSSDAASGYMDNRGEWQSY